MTKRNLNKKTRWLVCAVLLTVVPHTAFAGSDNGGAWRQATWNLGTNAQDAFFGKDTLPWHAAAVGATFLLIHTGADAKIQRWAAKHDSSTSVAWSAPGLFGGAVAPFLIPGGMLLSDNSETQTAGEAAMQAAVLALAGASVLKAVTGRRQTEDGVEASDKDARDFRFGFWRRGIVSGWPSGHAMTNMAMSAALAEYYYDRPKIRTAAYAWAGYVAASAALGDQGGTHWASDVVAGSLMGYAIGKSIGRKFRQKGTNSVFSVLPNAEGNGFVLKFKF